MCANPVTIMGRYGCNNKQLLDEFFVISGIIKVEVSFITLTETLII